MAPRYDFKKLRNNLYIFVLFQIIVDRPQQVTESHNKNIEVVILIIKTKNRQPASAP